MISKHITAALILAGDVVVLLFRQQKLSVGGVRVALVACNKFSFAGLVRIAGVIGAVGDGLGYAFAPIFMDGEQPRSGQK
jgi:hypothetical protein